MAEQSEKTNEATKGTKMDDYMERIISKVENILEKQIDDFEKNPVATSVRLLFFYWLFKKIYSTTKKG